MKTSLQRASIAAVVSLVFAACTAAGPTLTDKSYGDNHYQAFTHGFVTLACNLSCAYRWGESRGEMKVLYNGGQWIKLASKVMEIGYESNLAYFYLGRAAEGLGFDYAAFRYYGYAMRAHSCGSNCDGIAFPSELIARKDTVAKSIGARSIKAAEERAAADKVKAEADEKARAEAARAERVAMLKAATTAAYQKGALAVPAGYEQLVAEHFKSTGVEMPAREGPRAFPTDYRGDSIVDLVQRFESIDKLAVDEFTKTATVENRVAALAGKRFRFVFSATLNKNYLATKSGDGTQYDADGEILRVALWSRDRRILLGRRAADNPGYTTIDMVEKTTSREYIGQNAFGVKAEVVSMVVRQYGLALTNFPIKRDGNINQEIFATALDISPSAAKALKPDLMFYVDAVLGTPNPAVGSVLKYASGQDATISHPTSIYIGGSYLVAAVKEVGVYRKSTGQVLAWRTYP